MLACALLPTFSRQGHAKFLWIMKGMFRANGGCGYVKKPDFLLRGADPNNRVFDPSAPPPVQKFLRVCCLGSTFTVFGVSFLFFNSFAHLNYLHGNNQVTVYMGEGWSREFRHTHFDRFSPPDFFVKVTTCLPFSLWINLFSL